MQLHLTANTQMRYTQIIISVATSEIRETLSGLLIIFYRVFQEPAQVFLQDPGFSLTPF